MSAGLAEITATTEMTKTISANHGFPKERVWKYTIVVLKKYRNTSRASSMI